MSFRSYSWRNLGASHDGGLETFRRVFDQENTYWISKKKKSQRVLATQVCFFSTERLQDLRLPFHEAEYMDNFALSVVREERLCLLYQCAMTPKMEIWMTTNEIDETAFASWSKFLLEKTNTKNLSLLLEAQNV